MSRLLEYEGTVYVRPIGRGIILGGLEDDGAPYLMDAIEDALPKESITSAWEGRLRIVVDLIDE